MKIEVECNITQARIISEAMEKADECDRRVSYKSIMKSEGTLLAIVCGEYLSYKVLEETDLCHSPKKQVDKESKTIPCRVCGKELGKASIASLHGICFACCEKEGASTNVSE